MIRMQINCRVCAYPTTISVTAPVRLCPRCIRHAPQAHATLAERLAAEETALETAYRDFGAVVAAADGATRARYAALIRARTACGVDGAQWQTQRAREARTLALRDGLSDLLDAEARLARQCLAISAAITRLQDTREDVERVLGARRAEAVPA